MSTITGYEDVQKITVTLPRSLLNRLDEYVSARGRSRFIAEAVEERLAMAEQLAALEESAGAWRAEDHPEMQSGEQIDRWINELRQNWGRQEAGDVSRAWQPQAA